MRNRQNGAEKSAPVKIRTSNLLIRSQMLYPVELRAQNLIFTYYNSCQMHHFGVVLCHDYSVAKSVA
jgi:hypothetical protein